MSPQNPVIDVPPSWTLLQFNFAQALTNAGGTIPLVINPNVAYTLYCTHDPSPTCTPPPTNISQERFALHDNIWNIVPAFFRVVPHRPVLAVLDIHEDLALVHPRDATPRGIVAEHREPEPIDASSIMMKPRYASSARYRVALADMTDRGR